jgi:hypothetical protein
LRIDFLDLSEDVMRFPSGDKTAGTALKQWGPQYIFNPSEHSAERGLRNPKLTGSTRHGASDHDGTKRLNLTQVQHCLMSSSWMWR